MGMAVADMAKEVMFRDPMATDEISVQSFLHLDFSRTSIRPRTTLSRPGPLKNPSSMM